MFNFVRGYNEEQFCEIILNLDQWLRRKCRLNIFYLEFLQHFQSAEQKHLCNCGKECYEKQYCEIILNLGHWFRKTCRLKHFLSRAPAALLFGGAEPFL